MQPNVYAATTQIYIGAESPIGKVRHHLAVDSQYFTALDLVKYSVVDKLQVDEIAMLMGAYSATMNKDDRQRLTNRLLERIELKSAVKWNNLLHIAYADSNRQTALAVLEAFVNTLSENALSDLGVDQANLNGERDIESGQHFRVVDPPAVGLTPVSTNRTIWMALILMAGLVVGACLAWQLSLRNPVVDYSTDLSTIGGLPIVGTIAHAQLAQAKVKHQRDLLIFGIAAGGLLFGFAVVLLVRNLTEIFSFN